MTLKLKDFELEGIIDNCIDKIEAYDKLIEAGEPIDILRYAELHNRLNCACKEMERRRYFNKEALSRRYDYDSNDDYESIIIRFGSIPGIKF